jgi:hypothetical protein
MNCLSKPLIVKHLLCRLSNVPVRQLSTFPLKQLLLGCTSLDGAQADAQIAGLTPEWALIQGPPGTGEPAVVCLWAYQVPVACCMQMLHAAIYSEVACRLQY